MKFFLSVAGGAALGGVARYYVGGLVQQRIPADYPIGTLVVNIVGSLLVGVLLRVALEPDRISDAARLILITGFCGGFTTFSTFSAETLAMLQQGLYGRAAGYVLGSVVLALSATAAGIAVAGRIIGGAARGG